MKKSRKRKVQYEEMLPHELEEAAAEFPAAYAPFGSLEWHGKHLSLGNDCLKAHGILVRVAQKYGGVVVPPTYWGYLGKWHPWTMIDFGEEIVEPLYRKIFQGLVDVGFKVVIGVTGHNVAKQREAIQKAVDWIRQYSEGRATGYAMWEVDLTRGPESDTDHAAKWESSNLLYMRPDLVDLARIRDEDLETQEGRKEAGIWGLDPRIHASREVGEHNVLLCVDAIGQKAQELLASLKK